MPNHHMLQTINNANELRKLKSQILQSKLQKLQEHYRQTLQAIKHDHLINNFAENIGEYTLSNQHLYIQNEQQAEVEEQMKNMYGQQKIELQNMIQSLSEQLRAQKQQQKSLIRNKLEIIEKVKERQIQLLEIKFKVKKAQQTTKVILDSDYQIGPENLETNKKYFQHAVRRIRTNYQKIGSLNNQIFDTIQSNEYLQRAIETKASLNSKFEDQKQESQQLTKSIQDYQHKIASYIQQSENDIQKCMLQMLPEWLGPKLDLKQKLKNGYEDLYEIISEEIMRSGKYDILSELPEV